MDLELRHLRYFVAVAEERHFSRAALRLHMAQPPLSQQIRRLEAIVGTTLLVRTSRSGSLTPAGVAFLDRARRILALAGESVDEAARIGRGEEGTLDIGFVSSAITLGVPERIQAFRTRFPSIHTRLHEGQTAQILARLKQREVDLGIVRDAEASPDLVSVTLATEGYVAVLPRRHPLARRRRLDARALRDEPFVRRGRSQRYSWSPGARMIERSSTTSPPFRSEVTGPRRRSRATTASRCARSPGRRPRLRAPTA
jgi:DNA-binding transcriptional LysR family regulator